MARSCSTGYARDKVRYAKQFVNCLFEEDFSQLQKLSESKRNHVMCALSSLAKFLGKYEDFKRLVGAYGLKWKSVNAEDLLISRINKVERDGSVLNWVGEVKEKRPELDYFMDFMLITGLRYVEAIESYNLIINLAKEDRLDEYYKIKKEALEHFRFKQLFMRRTKKAFISFVPKEFIEKISKQKFLTRHQIKNRIQRRGLKLRFGDIREYYATFTNRYLTREEIDFLQGRISSNVFMRNYFNPALISDLKKRVFQALEKIEELCS
ncbi:MAG: integrase [Candidatus Bathyarchaeota archaeon]